MSTMTPDELRKMAERMAPDDDCWFVVQQLRAAADAWEKQSDADNETIAALHHELVALRNRLEEAEKLLMEYYDGDWTKVDAALAPDAPKED